MGFEDNVCFWRNAFSAFGFVYASDDFSGNLSWSGRFVISGLLGFSLIVMYDAIGFRRHAGMQAEVLNLIIQDLFQGHPISKRKIKELLGHTPSEVVAGAVLGILVACICCQSCFVAVDIASAGLFARPP